MRCLSAPELRGKPEIAGWLVGELPAEGERGRAFVGDGADSVGDGRCDGDDWCFAGTDGRSVPSADEHDVDPRDVTESWRSVGREAYAFDRSVGEGIRTVVVRLTSRRSP